MIAEESSVDPKAHATTPDTYAETLLYDFFKHMSSLSLITLGGVLTLSTAGGEDLKRGSLIIIVLFVAVAGISAMMGVDDIVTARSSGLPLPRRVHWFRRIAQAFFGLGVGAFLYTFIKVLN